MAQNFIAAGIGNFFNDYVRLDFAIHFHHLD
jgi:hypothetical protein